MNFCFGVLLIMYLLFCYCCKVIKILFLCIFFIIIFEILCLKIYNLVYIIENVVI